MPEPTDGERLGGADGRRCWCGRGQLGRVRLGGVTYLTCDACGGELGDVGHR